MKRIGKLSKLCTIILSLVLLLSACSNSSDNTQLTKSTVPTKGNSNKDDSNSSTKALKKIKDKKNKDIVLDSDKIVSLLQVSNEGTAYDDVILEIGAAAESKAEALFYPAWNFTIANKLINKGFLDGATLLNENGSINENDGPIKYKFDNVDKSLTMKIDEKFNWSNGDKFTVEDIIGTYLISADKSFSINQFYKKFNNIVGLESYALGYSNSISGLKKISDKELKINFVKWDPMIRYGSGILTEFIPGKYLSLDLMEDRQSSIRAFLKTDLMTKEPISYGPYVLNLSKDFDIFKQEYVYKANSEFWLGEAAVKEARLRIVSPKEAEQLIARGQFDIFYMPSEYYGESSVLNNGTTLLRPASSISYMSFRVGKPLTYAETNAKIKDILEKDEPKIKQLNEAISEFEFSYISKRNKELESKEENKGDSSSTIDVYEEAKIKSKETTEYKQLQAIHLKHDILKQYNRYNKVDNSLIDPALREAIYKMIDSDSINVGAFHGLETKAKNIIPPALNEFYQDLIEPYVYNNSEASKILDEAGYKDLDGDGFRETPDGDDLLINIIVQSRSQVDSDIESYFLKQMNLYGLNAKVDIQDVEEYNNYLNNTLNVVNEEKSKIEVFVGYLDFENNPDLRTIFDARSIDNFIYLDEENNQKFSEELLKAQSEVEIKKVLNDWSKFLIDNYYFVPMRNSYELVFVNNRVSSFDISDGIYTPYWKVELISFEPFKAKR